MQYGLVFYEFREKKCEKRMQETSKIPGRIACQTIQ